MSSSAEHAQKVALITGAGRGIGRAIARELAARGFSLCLAARSFAELEESRGLTRLPAERCLLVLVDLAEAESAAHLVDTCLHHYERLDVLVNNAGWAPPRRPLNKTSEADIDKMVAVNLRAAVKLSRLASIHMIPRGAGTIINVGSSAGRLSPPAEAVYSATKAGLSAFTRALFAELKDGGIRVSIVVPGLVDTALIPENKKLNRAAMIAPEDVAKAVGQIIDADPRVCPVEIVLEPMLTPIR